MSRRYIEAGRVARIGIARPDEILLRFELTMTLGEWQLLADDLEEGDGDARRHLRKMIWTMIQGATRAIEQTYSTTGWSEFAPEAESQPGSDGERK